MAYGILIRRVGFQCEQLGHQQSSGSVCPICGATTTCVHVYQSTIIPPTCTEEGYTKYVCINPGCDSSYTANEVPAKGHTESSDWFYDDERHWKSCIICDQTITNTKAQHISSGTNIATCQKQAICNTCNKSYGDFAPHNYDTSTWIKSTTQHWHACITSGCDEKIDVANHIPDRATATEEYGITCTECEYQIAPPLEHVHNYNQRVIKDEYKVTSATCETRASYHYSCTCGAEGTDIFYDGDFAPHDYGNLIPAEQPTCTENGSIAYYQCSVCDKLFDEGKTEIPAIAEIEALGHTFNGDSVCDVCGVVCEHIDSWNDNVCTVCGTICEHPEQTPIYSGDPNHPEFEPPYDMGYSGHYLICTTCGNIADGEHKEFGNYTYRDTDYHTYECGACGQKLYIVHGRTGDASTDGNSLQISYPSATDEQHLIHCDVCDTDVKYESHDYDSSTRSCRKCSHVCSHSNWNAGVCPDCGYECEHQNVEYYIIENENIDVSGPIHGCRCIDCNSIIVAEEDCGDTYNDGSSSWTTATSNNDGTHTYTCSRCNQEYTVNCSGSVHTAFDTQHATQCKYCGEYYLAHPNSSANQLRWVSENSDTHILRCTICGKTVDESRDHSKEVDNDIQINEGETYYHLVKCSTCGYTEEHELNIHQYDQYNKHKFECTICTFVSEDVECDITCAPDNDYEHSVTCSICGDRAPEEHTWDDGCIEVEFEETTDDSGIHTFYFPVSHKHQCIHCGYTRSFDLTHAIENNQHVYYCGSGICAGAHVCGNINTDCPYDEQTCDECGRLRTDLE